MNSRGPKKIIFSKEQTNLAISMYIKDGKSLEAIASYFKCSRSTIKHLLVFNSIKIRRLNEICKKVFSEKEKGDIITKCKENIPIAKIAKHYNCGESTLRTILAEWGVKLKWRNNIPRISVDELQLKKYGTLTVLKESDSYHNNSYRKVLCKCDCGNLREIGVNSLRMGDAITCGDYTKHRRGKEEGFKTIIPSVIRQYKKGAIRRGLEFNVTAKYLYKLFISQNECCALSGIKLTLPSQARNNGTASLDRINSSEGYTKSNVQWVFKDINMMKWAFNQDYFIGLCSEISKHRGCHSVSSLPFKEVPRFN